MKIKKLIQEIIGLIVTIIVIFTIVFTLNLFVFTISRVNQVSMQNTLFEGDIVYYNRLASKQHHFNRGDLVLFLTDGRERHGILDAISIKLTDLKDAFTGRGKFTNKRYVKRIIGIPGDIIEIDDEGNVYVNGVVENKPYVLGHTSKGNMEYPLKVPENKFFVLGDNREMSDDSRDFGCVSINSCEGKAVFILWPSSRVKRIK
ncbi:MAG: signal peptidase I [Clostridiaceae bacterium]|jgi:signal peptidase I|nr:signal peptidase I [Clostridiaceae bacterium]